MDLLQGKRQILVAQPRVIITGEGSGTVIEAQEIRSGCSTILMHMVFLLLKGIGGGRWLLSRFLTTKVLSKPNTGSYYI